MLGVEKVTSENYEIAYYTDGSSYRIYKGKEMNIEETIEIRDARYGGFKNVAHTSHAIKTAMRGSNGWYDLSNDKREALEMVAHKIARILNGNANYRDSWHDCIGYLRLIERDLV